MLLALGDIFHEQPGETLHHWILGATSISLGLAEGRELSVAYYTKREEALADAVVRLGRQAGIDAGDGDYRAGTRGEIDDPSTEPCPARGDDRGCTPGHEDDASLCTYCGNPVALEAPIPRASFRPAGDRRNGGAMLNRAHFIFFVRDQNVSTAFFRHVLCREPALYVPGMTEFELGVGMVLGLMPEAGLTRLLGASVDPTRAAGVARAELYLLVDDPAAYHARALAAGGRELSVLAPRDWAHETAYSADPDGHVIAFARELPSA